MQNGTGLLGSKSYLSQRIYSDVTYLTGGDPFPVGILLKNNFKNLRFVLYRELKESAFAEWEWFTLE